MGPHDSIKLIDAKIEALENSLSGYLRNDILVTTSLDKDSSLLLFLLQEAKIKADIVFINTGLIQGKVDENLEIFNDTFEYNLKIIDKRLQLEQYLCGKNFNNLSKKEQKFVCQTQKKDALDHHIKETKKSIWVTGIRRYQTEHRKSMKAISYSDGLIKYSPIFNLSNIEIMYILKAINLRKFHELIDLCKNNESQECGLHI